MAARALWSGAISFGLVNVPVKMYRATTSGAGRGVSFHQIHAVCGTRIQHVRRCPYCEREVPWEEVRKGYEFAKGRYAVLSEEDFAGLPKEDGAAIAIEDFVLEREIDPMLYDATYYLAPDGPPRAYALLHEALVETGKVAIARVLLRTRGHLAVVRPAPGRLILETMYWADEVVDAAEVPGVPAGAAPPAREVEMAERLIAAMSTRFEHAKYKDTYTDAVREVIERKIAGEEVTAARAIPASAAGVVDLMEALRRSMESVERDEGEAPEVVRPTRARGGAKAPSRQAAGAPARPRPSRRER